MTVCRSNFDVVSRDGFTITSAKWGSGEFRPSKGMQVNIFEKLTLPLLS
jgi:hypothetical protein